MSVVRCDLCNRVIDTDFEEVETIGLKPYCQGECYDRALADAIARSNRRESEFFRKSNGWDPRGDGP